MKIRRDDREVIFCGELIGRGLTTVDVEKHFGIPHSTVHWVVIHRLQKLDRDLWHKCLLVFNQHKHSSKRSKA